MPIVTSQNRPQVQAQTEDSWRAPHRTLQAKTMTDQKAAEVKTEAAATDSPGDSTVQSNMSKEAAPQDAKVTLSPQLTALARKEQSFRKQEQAHKATVKEFETKKAEFEAKQASTLAFAAMQDRLSKDDFSVLDEMNVSYEKWTQYLLNKPDGDKPEAQAVKKLEEKLNSLEAQQKSNVDKQYEATKNQYRKEIKDLVAKDERFDTIKSLKMEEDVLTHILDTFEKDGEALSVEEASLEVEQARTEEALKMAGLKKVKQTFAPVKEEKTLPPPKIKTLTNQVAQPATKTYPQFQHLSPRERIAQAIAKSQRQ